MRERLLRFFMQRYKNRYTYGNMHQEGVTARTLA